MTREQLEPGVVPEEGHPEAAPLPLADEGVLCERGGAKVEDDVREARDAARREGLDWGKRRMVW